MSAHDPDYTYLEPTYEAGRSLVQRKLEGPVVMLNLLRFREIADYTRTPELAPETPISGAEAFRRYITHALPYVRASGGELLMLGQAGPYLIGPSEAWWDLVMLVRQRCVESFLAFARDPGYMAGIGHRLAAVVDSRLLPLSEVVSPLVTFGEF